MAYADYNAYKNSTIQSAQKSDTGFRTFNAAGGNQAGRLLDMFTYAYPDVDLPTTAVVPTQSLSGALTFANAGTGRLVVNSIDASGFVPGMHILCDRLSHQGNLSGSLNTAQTTNLPTAALTRYTDGEGVIALVTIWSQIGTTATTYTISYTNQAGTSGKTSIAMDVSGSFEKRWYGRAFVTPLASGDTGVRSVESFTLAASTGGGNFGISLIKPLLFMQVTQRGNTNQADFMTNNLHGGLPEILDDAFLFWLSIPGPGTTAATGQVNFSEV